MPIYEEKKSSCFVIWFFSRGFGHFFLCSYVWVSINADYCVVSYSEYTELFLFKSYFTIKKRYCVSTHSARGRIRFHRFGG